MSVEIFNYIITFYPIDYILMTFIGGIVILFFVARSTIGSKGQIAKSLNLSLFLISLPKETKKEGPEAQKNEKEMISVMEQFYASLINLKEKGWKNFLSGSSHLIFEIATAAGSDDIRFYVACPQRFAGILQKQIQSYYPTAEVEPSEDYNIFNPQGAVSAAYIKLSRDWIWPIKTYQNLEADPLSSLTNALSKIPEGEGAAVQVLIKPIKGWQKRALSKAKEIQEGKKKKGLTQEFLNTATEGIGIGAKKNPNTPAQDFERQQVTTADQEKAKLLEIKASKVGFKTNIRIITSAATKERAEQLLTHLETSFAQFSSVESNSFDTYETRFRPQQFLKKLVYNFSFRDFNLKRSFVLNTEELASVYHFPIATTETPKMKWLKAKTASPPVEIPSEGLILGRNIYRGEETVIRTQPDDRRRHLYAIGQTGTGKSAFFGELIKQDIKNGQGVCVIDPHGDLVENILECIPSERANEVIIFDPSDTNWPMGLNMLEYKTDEQKDFAVQEMIAIFYKLFPAEMIGPMFEHNMRNVMLTLMEDKESGGTIAEIPRMFTDTEYQKYKLSKVRDPVVRAFWEKEMAKTTDFHKSEMLGYLISKVGRFIENEMMRNIIGQAKSGFDFRDVMDKGKILLVNLSKGKTGEVNSALLGLIIVSKLQMAAMSRTDLPQDERKDFYLYIDEFQNFTTDSVATILAEARKYRLNLSITHQFVAQLTEQIRDAVFGNVGTMVSFRIGAEDAEFLAKQYEPVFSAQDLINIDNYNAYLKLMINGAVSRPFNMTTYPPIKGNPKIAQAIKELSRRKYNRPKEEVEREILERSQLGSPKSVASPDMVPGERNL
jgi:hypothetical protein